MKKFSESEKQKIELFKKDPTFYYNGKKHTVIECDKPTCPKGEPKTDIYILTKTDSSIEEFKISNKLKNANFIENKINQDRAKMILGNNWAEIITQATTNIIEKFNTKPLIYKKSCKSTKLGSITLGWKYELLNKSQGDLSAKIDLTKEQTLDIYSGTNISTDKKNAYINGRIVRNSGVANYILIDDNYEDVQSIMNNIIPIEEYVEKNPEIYFACKALNYRTFEKKYDGNRPLSVYIDWKVINGKLSGFPVFNEPLIKKGDEIANKLKECLNTLNISTTNDITMENIFTPNIIIE